MNIIERVKNILISPKTEWEVINAETATPQSILMSYVLPLSIVAALGTILKGLLFAGTFAFSIKFFIIGAIIVMGKAESDNYLALILGFLAVILGTLNVVGGFVVTDRMLEMFKKKK